MKQKTKPLLNSLTKPSKQFLIKTNVNSIRLKLTTTKPLKYIIKLDYYTLNKCSHCNLKKKSAKSHNIWWEEYIYFQIYEYVSINRM